MRFDDIDEVKTFVGEDYETVYVPERARKVLKRFDLKSKHYELVETRNYREENMSLLEVKNLHVEVEGKKILNGLTLTIEKGQVAAIMGPNGSGKSTLAYVLAGKDNYVVTEGR